MKILQIHDSDLVGHNFNGYDLQKELIARGFVCKQLVKEKSSDDEHVIQMPMRGYVEQQLLNLERVLSLNNVFPPYGRVIEESKEFQEADIVHIHMVHHYLISYLDIPRLISKKKCVWTIHDPWIFTGHCVHPLECESWKTGCNYCPKPERYFQLEEDHAAQLWQMKKTALNNMDVDMVVATNFMMNYLKESPITENITHSHIIPFGINSGLFHEKTKEECREEMQLKDQALIIGFRVDDNDIKGCKYIWDMLRKLKYKKELYIATIGTGTIPKDIRDTYKIISWGWTNAKEEIIKFHLICDVFLMPSLAESFGVMAIEAMAAESTVICFKDTVVEEITRAPKCGIAVEYASSEAILGAMYRLLENQEELLLRGKLGREIVEQHYNMENYINQHISLYEEIMDR
ncbi:MAG: glycosyltransferase [Lachnospiraceae bacterium]